MKADPLLKELLKQRKFKWKTVTNDEQTGCRSEILEVVNQEFKNQMRRSKAEVFRTGLMKEDILREPISIYFSSMLAIGTSKDPVV